LGNKDTILLISCRANFAL